MAARECKFTNAGWEGQGDFSRTIILKCIFWGRGVKEAGWRFFDGCSYLSSSCCLSQFCVKHCAAPASQQCRVSSLRSSNRSLAGQKIDAGLFRKNFSFFPNEVTSYPLPRVYGVCKIAGFYSNSLATAQALPLVQLSVIVFFLCSTLRLEHSCRCITFVTPDNGFFFIMSPLDFSINFHPSWIFQWGCSEH